MMFREAQQEAEQQIQCEASCSGGSTLLASDPGAVLEAHVIADTCVLSLSDGSIAAAGVCSLSCKTQTQ